MSVFGPLATSHQQSFRTDWFVAAWVSQAGANHVGLAYANKESASNIKCLHLSGDGNLLDQDLKFGPQLKKYLIARIPVGGWDVDTFPAYLAKFHKIATKIPFGIDWLNAIGSFDSNGCYTPSQNSKGLTCATFLSEIFNGFGLQVVDEKDWPINAPESLKWRDSLVEGMRSRPNPNERVIQSILSTTPVVRLAPSEIAAALVEGKKAWPMKHGPVVPLAAQVVADFDSAFPADGPPSHAAVGAVQPDAA